METPTLSDVLGFAFEVPFDWRDNGMSPKDDFSIMDLVDRCRTEGEAYKFLEEMRWGGDPQACPHCGSVKGSYFLNPENGTSRKTRTGASSERRVWKCKDCRKQFSALTNTPFHGMRIPVRKMVFVVFEMCSCKNGVSAREIERKYNLTPRSAWYLLMRVREGMAQIMPYWDNATVVVDETFVGAKVQRMNAKSKKKHVTRHPAQKPGAKGAVAGTGGKTPVVTLINRETGQAYSRTINDVNRNTLREAISEVADVPTIDLHTDGHSGYIEVGKEARSHERADQSSGQYVTKNGGGTNQAESYFAQLKRSIDGTHHHVSTVHLPRYLSEFDFRHNTHKLPDSLRMSVFYQGLNGKRITYQPTGRI